MSEELEKRYRTNFGHVIIETPFEICFPRGEGPLVSVLIPTRGRPKDLCESIDSLVSLATIKSFEFILKIDDDDKETLQTYNKLIGLIPVTAIVSPRGRGYLDMHIWVNQMCTYATGDWILLWNDDARMTLKEWDVMLLTGSVSDKVTWHGIKDIFIWFLSTKDRPGAREFAFVRRKMIEVMGHYSLNPHNDSWLAAISSFISSAFNMPIEVEHRSEEIGDKIRSEVLDVYDQTGRHLNSVDMLREKCRDVLRLIDYIEEKQKERSHGKAL